MDNLPEDKINERRRSKIVAMLNTCGRNKWIIFFILFIILVLLGYLIYYSYTTRPISIIHLDLPKLGLPTDLSSISDISEFKI